jgi:hypothetical protein
MNIERLKDITHQVDLLVDGLGKEVDPGIKKAVIAFNYIGLPTIMSCEGHMDYGCPYPWIWVDDAEPGESYEATKIKNTNHHKRVLELIKSFYSKREMSFCSLQTTGINNYTGHFRVQSPNYTPRTDDIRAQLVVRNQEILFALQKEMSDFADYILTI